MTPGPGSYYHVLSWKTGGCHSFFPFILSFLINDTRTRVIFKMYIRSENLHAASERTDVCALLWTHEQILDATKKRLAALAFVSSNNLFYDFARFT